VARRKLVVLQWGLTVIELLQKNSIKLGDEYAIRVKIMKIARYIVNDFNLSPFVSRNIKLSNMPQNTNRRIIPK
jgi:hypothetical protein